MIDVETPIDETLIEKYPEMYHGKGGIFQALYELKRLISKIEYDELSASDGKEHEHKVRSIELAFAAKDIERELLKHIKFSILDKEASITFNIGQMDEEKFHRLVNFEEKLRYPYESEVLPESCKYADFTKEDDIISEFQSKIAPNNLH